MAHSHLASLNLIVIPFKFTNDSGALVHLLQLLKQEDRVRNSVEDGVYVLVSVLQLQKTNERATLDLMVLVANIHLPEYNCYKA